MAVRTRFSPRATLPMGTIENIYVDFVDSAVPTALTDLNDASSITFKVYDSNGSHVAALDGTCTTALLVAEALIDTTKTTGGTAEVQHLSPKASSGNWSAQYKGRTTGNIAFDASTATVQAALRALHPDLLHAVVTGGPGSLGESTPFIVTIDHSNVDPDQIAMIDVSLSGSGHGVTPTTATPWVAGTDVLAPGSYNLYVIVAVTDDDAETIESGPYPFTVVAA